MSLLRVPNNQRLVKIGMVPPLLFVLAFGGATLVLIVTFFLGNYLAVLAIQYYGLLFVIALSVSIVIYAVFRLLLWRNIRTVLIAFTILLYALPIGYFVVTSIQARLQAQEKAGYEKRVTYLVKNASNFQECNEIVDARYESCMEMVLLKTSDLQTCEGVARRPFRCLTIFVRASHDLDRCVTVLGDLRRCAIEIAEQEGNFDGCQIIRDDTEGFDQCITRLIKTQYGTEYECYQTNTSASGAAYCFFTYRGGGGVTNWRYPVVDSLFRFCDQFAEGIISIGDKQYCSPCQLLFRDVDKQSCGGVIQDLNEWVPRGSNRSVLFLKAQRKENRN